MAESHEALEIYELNNDTSYELSTSNSARSRMHDQNGMNKI